MAADSEAMATPTSAPVITAHEREVASVDVPVEAEKSMVVVASPGSLSEDKRAIPLKTASPAPVDDMSEEEIDAEDAVEGAVESPTEPLKEEREAKTTETKASETAEVDTSVPPTPPTALPPLASAKEDASAKPVVAASATRVSASARGEGQNAGSEARALSSSTMARPQSTSHMEAHRSASAHNITNGSSASAKGWNMQHYIRSNAKISRLVQAALLKTLVHAIRRGSVEGVRVAIERGVLVQYIDSRQRNLIMLATKCDTDARLPIVVILADAGCDIDHADQLGWNCLHYACASGALDVATELIRRGARIEYNPYGYGPEDFVIPKVLKAKSLLQHTEQLQHEKNVKACWDFFTRQAEQCGYAVKCRSHCDLGKPLRVAFQAPSGHSSLDRIRVVDMNSDVALWLQASKNFTTPPGDIGSITLDSETLDRPSLYRIFYEKYEPTPLRVPRDVAENAFSIKNLDTGTTVSVGSVNQLVLKELESTRSGRRTKQTSSSSREAPDSRTKSVRRMSTTRFRNNESEHDASEHDAEEMESETVPNDTITVATVEEHPAVNSITGVYRIVAMAIVSVSTLNSTKPNEYEVTIKKDGLIGLQMEPKVDSSKRMTKLIVRRSSGQAASVNPGDCLVAIGQANIENAGLKHTLWELNEAPRPMVLRFRRGTQKEKKSLFTGIRQLSGAKSMASISV